MCQYISFGSVDEFWKESNETSMKERRTSFHEMKGSTCWEKCCFVVPKSYNDRGLLVSTM